LIRKRPLLAVPGGLRPASSYSPPPLLSLLQPSILPPAPLPSLLSLLWLFLFNVLFLSLSLSLFLFLGYHQGPRLVEGQI
jgi:hypothetical protein